MCPLCDSFVSTHAYYSFMQVSKTLRVAVHPERVTAIEGVRGLAVDVSTGADHLSAVANEYECSHQCTVHIDCAGYTWLATEASAASGNGGERIGAPDNNNNNNGDSPSGKSVLGMLKAALGVGSADGDASASGDCYIFFDDQAAAATRVFFQPHSMSGARVDHADRFPSRLRSLLTPADPMDANQFSSRAIRVSFGGGRPEELPASWQVSSSPSSANQVFVLPLEVAVSPTACRHHACKWCSRAPGTCADAACCSTDHGLRNYWYV